MKKTKNKFFGSQKTEKTKMNVKKIMLGIAAIASVGLIASTALVSAFQGDPTKQGHDYDADLHNLKVDAFNSNDYEVWKDLMEQAGGNGRVLEVVNEENFNTFVQAHNAALEGNMELSKELRSQLGLNNGEGPRDGTGYRDGGEGKGMKQGNGQGMKQGGQGQMLNQANFVDADGDGVCDNTGLELNSNMGQGKGQR